MSEPRAAPYLHGGLLAAATIALALGNFMEVLDTTIANVSVPSIAGDLGVSPSQGTWVITSYAVANAISVLLAGWLAQRFGQVRVFAAAVLLFTFASWLCASAVDFEMLLAARVLQGAVAGLMVPLSQALLMSNYPEDKRGLALAIWGMTVVIAPVLGPILGGWITDNVGWPWIFYINIPVGLVVAFMTWQLLGRRDTPTRKVPVDTVGLALIVLWVGALQILLDKGNELDWFGSSTIVALAIAAALGLALFLAWELTEAHPIVDLRLFAIRNFRMGTLALALGFGVFFGSVVLLPLWLQTQMGYTASWAGLVLAPSGVLAFVLSPVVGKNLHRLDPRVLTSVAFAVFALVSFMRAGYATNADYATLALPQWLFGVGIALFFAPLMTIAQGSVPAERLAYGAGLINFLRNTAASFGASLAITFWDRRAALHHSQLAEHVSSFAPTAQNAASQLAQSGFAPGPMLAQINRIVTTQSAMLATNDIFWISGWLFLLLIATVWLTRRPFGVAAAGGH